MGTEDVPTSTLSTPSVQAAASVNGARNQAPAVTEDASPSMMLSLPVPTAVSFSGDCDQSLVVADCNTAATTLPLVVSARGIAMRPSAAVAGALPVETEATRLERPRSAWMRRALTAYLARVRERHVHVRLDGAGAGAGEVRH